MIIRGRRCFSGKFKEKAVIRSEAESGRLGFFNTSSRIDSCYELSANDSGAVLILSDRNWHGNEVDRRD